MIVASIHNRLDAAQMTARIERAMRLPVFKIWGHPLGRLLGKRDSIDCELERVLDAIAESPAAVELSGDPWRIDLPPEHIPAARARGLRFVISTDAHSTADFDNLRWGVASARRGGVRRSEVLNALDAGAFAHAVSPRMR